MSQDLWLSVLEANKKLETQQQVENFEEALSHLAEKSDPAVVRDLFLIFDDDAVKFEVLWGLVHFIETFETRPVLDALTDVTPSLMFSASEWLRIFYTRILNHDESRMYLRDLMSTLSQPRKQAIRQVMNTILQTKLSSQDLNEQLKAKVQFVLSE